MSYRECYQDVLKLALETTNYAIIDNQITLDPNTHSHQIATGAMVKMVLEDHGFEERIQRYGALAGALHDAGKYHPRIQELMQATAGRAFTVDERQMMRRHARLGYDSISGLPRRTGNEKQGSENDRTVILRYAAYTALRHHDIFTRDDYARSPGLTGIAHLVQFCDVSHARLLDCSRSYRADRDGGVLESNEVAMQIYRQFSALPPVILGQEIDIAACITEWCGEAEALRA